ncbi:MAG: AraC family transcriptional regulator [Saprospiraceae bacterium]
MERFIERGTDYQLDHGVLSIYDTNCAAKGIKFYFDQYVLTAMVCGHKTIESDHLKIEFVPGTFFIPERRVIQHVCIPNASLYNPTRCLVLKLNPAFTRAYYEEVYFSQDYLLADSDKTAPELPHFLSNDTYLVQTLFRLYENQNQSHTPYKREIDTLIIKEILIRVFHTSGLSLLKADFEQGVDSVVIQKVIMHIKSNLHLKLSIDNLAKISGMGLTTFFKAFKSATGYPPAEYILRERIATAKVLIQKNQLQLKEIAYRCGFNSYQYFCNSFQKIAHETPLTFKKRVLEESYSTV